MAIKTHLNKIYTVIGVMLTLAAFYGLYYTVDTQIAKAEDVKRIEIKVDSYIISNEIRDLQKRIWEIEDRYGKDVNRMPPEWKNEYRCLQNDLIKEKQKLKEVK